MAMGLFLFATIAAYLPFARTVSSQTTSRLPISEFARPIISLMKSIRVSIPNVAGHQLSAQLELPLGEHPQAFAMFAHCFTCGKNLKAEHNISLALTQQRMGVIRFDFAGVGESEGEFFDTNFSTNLSDLQAVYDWMEANYQAPQLLVGHSLGGAAVLAAATDMPAVKAIATIGAPAEPLHVRHLFEAVEERIRREGEGQVLIGGRPFTIQRHFLEDLEKISLRERLSHLNRALLVLHAPGDQVVGVHNAREIYDAALHPKSFLTLDGADHLLLRKQDSLYAGRMIGQWAARYLDLREPEPIVTDKQVVARLAGKGYTTEMRAGKHSFLADEPSSVGGDDLGPTPYDLLIAGLGACTAMTMRMYADRKGWPLKEVRVHLQHEKVYAEDQQQAGAQPRKLDRIEREIEIDGELDHKQRQRLMEIADRCPVHRTLLGDLTIVTAERQR